MDTMDTQKMKNKIFCNDCLEILSQIPDNSIDLIFTDPPYNEKYIYRGTNFIDYRDDYYEFLEKVLIELKRILKDTGSLYIKHSSRQINKIIPLLDKYFTFRNLIIWISNSLAHPKKNYDSFYEPIYFYTKTNNYTFNKRAEYRAKPPNFWSGCGKEFVGLLSNMWYDIKKIQEGCLKKVEGGTIGHEKLHPCSMPIRLAERAIKVSSNEGDIVLDPFAGICTTAVACIKTKRNFICIEKEKLYAGYGKERIENIQYQAGLFDKTDPEEEFS